MKTDTWPSLTAMFFDQAEALATRPFLWAKRDGAYRPWTWAQVADQVRALARALGAQGARLRLGGGVFDGGIHPAPP